MIALVGFGVTVPRHAISQNHLLILDPSGWW